MTHAKRNTRPPSSFQTVGPATKTPSYTIALDLLIVGAAIGLALAVSLS